jgi:hypothetical protein
VLCVPVSGGNIMCSKIKKSKVRNSVVDVDSTLRYLYPVFSGSVAEVSEVHVPFIFRAAWAVSHLHILFI